MHSVTNFLFSTAYILGTLGAAACMIIFILYWRHTSKALLRMNHAIMEGKVEDKSRHEAFTRALALMDRKHTENSVSLITPDMDKKMDEIVHALREINNQIKILESKVGDINMRVSIAEVRLEERKAQPLLTHVPAAISARRGRKPRIQ